MKEFNFNTKLVLNLSMFGVILGVFSTMGFALGWEWVLWLVGWAGMSLVISKKQKEKYFIHGFSAGFLFAFIVSLIKILLYDIYIENHPYLISQFETNQVNNPRMYIISFGVITAVFSGLITGVMTLGFRKFLKK
ncbi:MAG: hypothetical protein HUU54_03485 [Ignavibacteriaceae bacterium]|nr:hypothetical protein [Ignavibacteriaceae bacterium]